MTLISDGEMPFHTSKTLIIELSCVTHVLFVKHYYGSSSVRLFVFSRGA